MSKAITVHGRQINITGKFPRIAAIEGDKYCFLDDPFSIIAGLKKSGQHADLFTFMQGLKDPKPKYDFPMEWDNFAALPIKSFDEWWMQTLGFKGRNKAKQAEKKGVKLREVPFDESLVQGIWKINNECPVRQGRKFAHYGMSIERTREYAGTFLEQSVFIGAFVDENLIGFAKLTIDETKTQAGLMHIISMVHHRDKAPTNALIVQAVRACADRKVPYLVYSNFAYGKKQTDSLSDFKERNGFQKIDVPRYYVPLNSFGKLAFQMKLHHKLVDRLPESLAAKLRAYRTSWYNRQLQSNPETA